MYMRPIFYVIVFACALIFDARNVAYADDSANDNTTPSARPMVRHITIEVREIFDEPNLGAFYRGVNKIKAQTREDVVRRELLIHEGEAFDEFLVQESERNLRSLPYLRDISITPIPDGDVVDLVVSVQDTWTIFPQLGFSSGGGTNKRSIGLAEGNVLGFGKRAEVQYAENEGRKVIAGTWEDKRVLDTHQRLFASQTLQSDGYRTSLSYGRPFRSLVEPYSWGADAELFDVVGRLFEDGDERFIYRQRHIDIAGGYTLSGGNPEVLSHRYTAGYRFQRDVFRNADDSDFEDIDLDPEDVSRDPGNLAENRRFSGPFIAYQQIEPDFVSLNYVDRFERVEDFNLGNQFDANLGVAPKFLDSMEDAALINISDSDGYRISPTSFLRGELGFATRGESDGFDNSLIRAEAKYINVLGVLKPMGFYIGKHTTIGSLSIDDGEKLDRDREFILGAENGLRGYADRTFNGKTRMVVNLEDRFHLIEDIYRLVSLGGAVFADAGGVSNKGVGDLVNSELYYDVGMGLRFGLPRSANGTVLRLDVALPLRDGPDGSNKYEPRVLITLGQVFSAQLRSERLGAVGANESIGLAR